MNKQPNRKAILISAVITVLVMGLASLAIFKPNRLSASSATLTPIGTTVVAPATSQTQADPTASQATSTMTDAQTQALIAEYQAKLNQAYQALQDAYNQIQALQAAQGQQSQNQGRFRFDDDGGERGGRTIPFNGVPSNGSQGF